MKHKGTRKKHSLSPASIQYILEEVSVLMGYGNEKSTMFLFYPGEEEKAFYEENVYYVDLPSLSNPMFVGDPLVMPHSHKAQ